MTSEKGPLFSLKPISDQAKIIVDTAVHGGINSHLILFGPDGSPMLGIGHHPSQSASPTILALLGRDNSADVYLDNNSIAKVQASFEINPHSKAIMFVDRSPSESSQVFGQNVVPFEHGRSPRQIVIDETINTNIGLGGLKRNHITFKTIWNPVREGAVTWNYRLGTGPKNPYFQMNLPEGHTTVPSRRLTRTHTTQKRAIRYAVGNQVGEGSRGTVFRGMNLDTGDLMAVKTMSRPQQEESRLRIKTEIETLSRLNHAHIVDYFGTEESDQEIVIFMRLLNANLFSLIGKPEVGNEVFLNTLLYQMLQALDYLACHNITHGDVSPKNILYLKGPNSTYQFQLADFGLCHTRNHLSESGALSKYMAPEAFYKDEAITPKADVWSLYVAMLFITNHEARDVLHGPAKPEDDQYDAMECYGKMLELAPMALKPYLEVREMARINPGDRASAAQMLTKYYGGNGLTTRNWFLAIPEWQDDFDILRQKHRYYLNRKEKTRLMKEWSIASSDLSTLDGSDDEENEGNRLDEMRGMVGMDENDDADKMDESNDSEGSDETCETVKQLMAELEKEGYGP